MNESLLKSFNTAVKRPFKQEDKETDTQWDYYFQTEKESDNKYINVLVLRFECTKSLSDWKSNFDFKKTPYKHMTDRFKVHRGILRKYKSIRERLLFLADSKSIDKIEIYGYSQGAALALLAHEDIWFNFPGFRHHLYTIVFGCPRVFGWKADKKRWHTVFRVENGNDVVTKLPFFLLGFKHVGNKIHIGRERKLLRMSVQDHENYKEVLRGDI